MLLAQMIKQHLTAINPLNLTIHNHLRSDKTHNNLAQYNKTQKSKLNDFRFVTNIFHTQLF